MPEEATVEDVEQIHIDSWKMGLKAVAIYRDNCKVGQPLSMAKKGADGNNEVAAYLSGAGLLLALVDVAEGDAIAAMLPVAEILRGAMLRGAEAIILAHNHPAGDATPSLDDLRATRRLADVAGALGLSLLDHIVVARGGCRSFRLMGLL